MVIVHSPLYSLVWSLFGFGLGTLFGSSIVGRSYDYWNRKNDSRR